MLYIHVVCSTKNSSTPLIGLPLANERKPSEQVADVGVPSGVAPSLHFCAIYNIAVQITSSQSHSKYMLLGRTYSDVPCNAYVP